MGLRVFLERLTLGAIARARVEAVGVEPGIEHDRAVALALGPALAAGEKPRADAFMPPICHDRHLPELHRLAVEGLHRNRPDHGPARGGAEMLAAGVVGELILAQGEAERGAQDRLAQGERPAIKVRPERRLDELEVVLLGPRRAHGLEERCSTMAQIALIWGASLPR